MKSIRAVGGRLFVSNTNNPVTDADWEELPVQQYEAGDDVEYTLEVDPDRLKKDTL